MNNCFISVVGVIKGATHLPYLTEYLKNVHQTLADAFSDYEIILVNNNRDLNPGKDIEVLDANIKKDIFLLELSYPTSANHATLAGLDRSNGDYTIVFDLELANRADLILALFEKTKAHNDIVYLRSKLKKSRLRYPFFHRIFHWILKNYSNLQIDHCALDSRIISRRALNSLLRLRESMRYMKAIYSIVGYQTASIELDGPLEIMDYESFQEKFKHSLIAITSYTTFLRKLLFWIFMLSFIFLILVVINAVTVKLVGRDLLGNIGDAVPGWAFLVLFISVFFAVVCLNLYLMSIYLSNIYEEIKQRPLYIIESIKRY